MLFSKHQRLHQSWEQDQEASWKSLVNAIRQEKEKRVKTLKLCICKQARKWEGELFKYWEVEKQ